MRKAVIGIVLFVLLAASCSLGEREEWANAIHDAPEITRATGSANVAVKVGFDPIEIIGTIPPEPLLTQLGGVVDFDHFRSRLTATKPRKIEFIADRLTLFLPRSEASEGDQRWVSIDFVEEPEDDIDVQDRRFSLGAPIIPPALALDLLEGALTGSVEQGKTTAGLTEYSAKVSQDNAVREIEDDEDRVEGLIRMLDTMGAGADVFPITVALDSQGRVRTLRLILKQQQDRVNSFSTTIRYDFSGFGTPVKITDPKNALKTDDFQQFVTEFIREAVNF